MPSLKLLEAFYWVARLRGFHAAADRLHVTQPSVSYRVKELEAQLGRPLLLRDGRSFKLTAHGQALFGHAERIIAAAQDLEQQFRPNGLSTGPMRLGVTDAFAAVCLPHLLRRLMAEHPSLDITVMVDHSHRLTHAVDQGDLDVAVVSTPPQLTGLRYEQLGQQHVGWIGGSAGAGQPAEDLAWISGARIFVTPPPSNLETITTAWFQSVGVAIPRLSVCNSMSAIVGLIEAQTGIGILPFPMVAACIAAGKMRHLGLPGDFPVQGIFATYSRGILDIGVGDTLRAIRTIVREQAFCDARDASQ